MLVSLHEEGEEVLHDVLDTTRPVPVQEFTYTLRYGVEVVQVG